MKKFFIKQYEFSNPITEELLVEIPSKVYYSGLEKQVGDVILYALEPMFIEETNEKPSQMSLNLISLCEREFEKYEKTHIVNESKFNEYLNFPILIKMEDEKRYNLMRNDFLKK
jgi:hypothetical protein